jgi:hypothetical protein
MNFRPHVIPKKYAMIVLVMTNRKGRRQWVVSSIAQRGQILQLTILLNDFGNKIPIGIKMATENHIHWVVRNKGIVSAMVLK